MQKEVLRKILLKASDSGDVSAKQAILEHLKKSGPEVHAKFFEQVHKLANPNVYHNSLKSPHEEGVFAQHLDHEGYHYIANKFGAKLTAESIAPIRVPTSRMQAAQFIASHPDNPNLVVAPHSDYVLSPAKHMAYQGKTYSVPAKLRSTGQSLGVKFGSSDYWENFVKPIFNPKSRINIQVLKDAADASIPELKDSWEDLPVVQTKRGTPFSETLKDARKTDVEPIQYSGPLPVQRIKPIVADTYDEYKERNVPAWEEFLNRSKLPLMLAPEMSGFQKPEYMGNWFDSFMREVLQSDSPLPEGFESGSKAKNLQTLISGLKGELGNPKVFYDHLRQSANEMLEHGNPQFRRRFAKEYGKNGGTNRFYNLPRLTAKINMLERMSNPEFHPHNSAHPQQNKVHSMLDQIAARKVGKGSFSKLGEFLSNQSHYDKYMGTRKVESAPKTSLDVTASEEGSSPISQSISDDMMGIDTKDVQSFSDALQVFANSRNGKIPINLANLVNNGHIKSRVPDFIKQIVNENGTIYPADLAKVVKRQYELTTDDQAYNDVVQNHFEKHTSPFLEELFSHFARRAHVPEDQITDYTTGTGGILDSYSPEELSDFENLGHHFLSSGGDYSFGLDYAPHILDGTLTSGEGKYRKHYAFNDADKKTILSAMHGYNYLKQKGEVGNKKSVEAALTSEMQPEEWDDAVRGRQLIGAYLHRLLQAGQTKSIGGVRGIPDLPPQFMARLLTNPTGQKYLGKYDRLSTPFGAGTRIPIQDFDEKHADNIAQTLASLNLNGGRSFSELSQFVRNRLTGNTYGTSHNRQNWQPTWNGVSAFLKDQGLTDPRSRATVMKSLLSGKAYRPDGINESPDIGLDDVRKDMIRDEISPLIFQGEYVEDVHDLLNRLDDAKNVKDIWHLLSRLPQSGKLVKTLL